MRTRLLLPLLALSLVSAGPFGKKKAKEPLPVAVPPPAAAVATPPPLTGLFAAELPLAVGPVPAGLANLSAQGCNACHYEAHDAWSESPHATGSASPEFVEAVARAGTPACTACHLPLAVQHADNVVYEEGDPERPHSKPNPDWDATLGTEGVTCAACHVRDGQIVAAAPNDRAPHPVAWSPELQSSDLCASCHQLSWPGADLPLYDTYGEWERSPQARAGIQCQDCHMASGADERLGHDHRSAADPARAVSVLLDVDRVDLSRGGSGLELALKLQNTGAGHAFPTGSPWNGVRVTAALVGPIGTKGETGPHPEATRTLMLQRQLEPQAPWRTIADTRLPAGGEVAHALRLGLPASAEAGDWALVVTLQETLGERAEPPFFERRIPLRVD